MRLKNLQTQTSKSQINLKNQLQIALVRIGCFVFFLFILLHTKAFAQRDFAVCDSTTYILNSDTTIIAGKNHLYLHTNNSIITLYDFTSTDLNEYIVDFDIIKPDLWYTVVGNRYIGNPASLYKSKNRGKTWALDTNHYNASNAQLLSQQFLRSINNLQHLNGDTLIMFMHYYESGIIYSTDLGLTWTKWFNNLIAHYQGMFECNNQYYIYAYEGDGFKASMFGFNKNLLFTSDSTGLWKNYNLAGNHPPCYAGADTVNCIFAPNDKSRCETFNFFKNKIDTICTALMVNNLNKKNYNIYPNPFSNVIHIEGASGEEMYTLKNYYGQTIWTGKQIEQQSFHHIPNGIYFLIITKENKRQTLKLIKQ